jgi:4-hydroxybenzoate polyprenyltransferase
MISRQTALVVAGGAALTGLLCSFLLSRVNGMMAAGAVVSLYFYSARLKGTVLLGNLLVSLFTGLAFLFGSAAVGRFQSGLRGHFCFFDAFGARIIKDMQDVPGDRQQLAAICRLRMGCARK